ncbi:MAG: histidinol-phosphate aminotransferase family protein, partial [Calditrichia bacterium]|nr:histidinol-phosphate aminotransferase family protein [Calditrichia bacterium]
LFDLLVNPFGSMLMLNQEYEYIDTLSQMYQLEVTKLNFERNFTFPVDNIIEELKTNNYDLVYFSNPNNPTGAMLGPAKLSKILSVANCPVIVDECYVSFADKNMQPLLAKFPNLILVRSFALDYGVASARLGYVLADENVIIGLKKVLSPFLLGVFSEVIITVLMEYKDKLLLRTNRIKQIREYVFNKLQKYELITAYPSQGNFILIQYPFNADNVRDWYLEKDILVKSLSHYSELAQMIRVSISDEESMKLFLKATNEIINEKMKDFL